MGSLVVEPNYLFHVSAAFFNITDPEMITIVHRVHGDHPKFFLEHNTIVLVFSFSDQILGILWLS